MYWFEIQRKITKSTPFSLLYLMSLITAVNRARIPLECVLKPSTASLKVSSLSSAC